MILSCILLSIPAFVVAQNGNSGMQLSVSMSEPEWNKTWVCDGGKGANVSDINPPVLGLSMDIGVEVPDDILFDYKWEKTDHSGAWMVVKEENNVTTVPRLNIGKLINDNPEGKELWLAWRLKVRHDGSEEWFNSEEYSIRIIARMNVKHVVTPHKDLNQIDLKVIGGKGRKSYQWTNVKDGNKIPNDQRTSENPKGLSAGVYQVLIKDDCEEKVYTVEIKDVMNK